MEFGRSKSILSVQNKSEGESIKSLKKKKRKVTLPDPNPKLFYQHIPANPYYLPPL